MQEITTAEANMLEAGSLFRFPDMCAHRFIRDDIMLDDDGLASTLAVVHQVNGNFVLVTIEADNDIKSWTIAIPKDLLVEIAEPYCGIHTLVRLERDEANNTMTWCGLCQEDA